MTSFNQNTDSTISFIKIRQNKYLNNRVEQDHRFIKRRFRSMLGFKSFQCAKIILSFDGVKHQNSQTFAFHFLIRQNPIFLVDGLIIHQFISYCIFFNLLNINLLCEIRLLEHK
ncbi:DDE-type integrase/transposase/recombinase [Acinetobacter sp. B10A]|nr:DDE-type integrase/transposase/recombinase [Acinetobacter baretiae]